MILFDFVKEFLCPNTLFRLVYKDDKGGHYTVEPTWDIVSMEHEILNHNGPFRDYINRKVIGVKDIYVCGGNRYSEAINILIEKI